MLTEKSVDALIALCIEFLDRIENETVRNATLWMLKLYTAWFITFCGLARQISPRCVNHTVLPKLEDMLNSHKITQMKRRK